MPPKIRDLIAALERAGYENRGGKGSHRNFFRPDMPGVVTLSGAAGDDALPYQIKRVQKAIKETGR
jgi:predicted RNA binding protein YcfA (HicA-like mRNA interferase family)